MLRVLRQEELDSSFPAVVQSFPGGEKIAECIQCGMCSGSCPMSLKVQYTPRKIIEMVRAGLRDAVLNSNTIWHCASCYLCAARCPRGIKITEIMYILKNLAAWKSKDISAAFYRYFLLTVRKYGRVHEMELILRFKLRTGGFWALVGLMPLGAKMFRKGKISVLPQRIRGIAEVRKLYRLAEQMGGVYR